MKHALLRAALLLPLLASPGLARAQASEPEAPEASEAGPSDAALEALLDSPERQPDAAGPAALPLGPDAFASLLTTPELARAKAELDRGRAARARALLARLPEAEAQALPARWLRALSAARAGAHAEAADGFAALAAEWPVLRDLALLQAAQANARTRRTALAAEQFAAVSPASRHFADARFGLARVLERRGDLPGAQGALEPLYAEARSRDRAHRATALKALLAACDLARKRGDYNGEHRLLLEVWATSPTSREAEDARRRLQGLPLPHKWKVRRAEALLQLHLHEDAVRLVQYVLPHVSLPDPLACRAHFVVGSVLRKERQHRRAIAALAPVARQCASAEWHPQALYVLGYSASIVEPPRAVEAYAQLARDYPGHGLADDALFFEARLHLRAGDAEAARERFLAVAARYPAGNFAPDALFQAFLLQRERGDAAGALATLERTEALPGAPRDALWRARYWRARTLEEAGQGDAALVLYRRVHAEQPATWYGLLARSRLPPPERTAALAQAAAATPPPAPAPGALPDEVWPLVPGALASDPHFAEGLTLVRLGLAHEAAEALLAAERRGLTEDAARLLFQALQRTGARRSAGLVARTLQEQVGELPVHEARALWEAKYPRPFRRAIERHGRAGRVDPDLLQALIREESRFNPRARSSTGALGLAQLMPATARIVAASLRLGPVGPETLVRPEDNIQLGAAYLGQLLDQFGGNPAHAVASYNAGPGAVRRWVRQRPGLPVDEWVERVPFDETREYVKRVLGSYNAYKVLYAPGRAPSLTVTAMP